MNDALKWLLDAIHMVIGDIISSLSQVLDVIIDVESLELRQGLASTVLSCSNNLA